MTTIECKLFGSFSIKENGREVFVPAGKVSGVFFYVLMKKLVSRDELAELFWSDSNEERAKISLRNAIHKIRKVFESDIITSPNRSMLALNEDINIVIDVEEFERDSQSNLHLYSGDFLKGLYIKDAIEFEYWVNGLREYYKGVYESALLDKIELNYKNENYKNLEKDINDLISVDSYNEKAYLYLMNLYKINGRYDKVINEYFNIQRILNEDLGIEPPESIKDIYDEAVEQMNRSQKEGSESEVDDFYSREYELEMLQKNLDDFKSGREYKSVLLYGESGIGKTVLKKKLLKENEGSFKVFEVNCYGVEKSFSYSPWVKLINTLNSEIKKYNYEEPTIWDNVERSLFYNGLSYQTTGNILENKEKHDSDIVYNAVFQALRVVSKDQKVIIVLEDIQWADVLSINLLINLILNLNENVIIIATKSDESDENSDRLLNTLTDLDKVLFLELKRFTKTDVNIIVRRIIENKDITEEDIDNIYDKSLGNAFFLKEYIELFKRDEDNIIITTKMHDIIQEKFTNLNDDEITILRIISVFYGSVTIDMLLKLIDMAAFNVVKILNSFVRKNILIEKEVDGQFYIGFAHSAYKDFIYSELNEAVIRIINKEIADTLESELIKDNKDITSYIQLKYHYEQANDQVKALKYEVYILNYYLNFNHEVFPNLDDYDLSKQVKINIKNDRAIKWMNSVEEEILKAKNLNRSNSRVEDINEIELLYLYCKGRYLIRGGNYSQGVQTMNRVISLSREQHNNNMKILGHKQMVIYGIQINDADIMLKHIIDGIKVAKTLNDNNEMGVLYRLYGVYYLTKGDFKQAEQLFEKSIDIFTGGRTLENTNSISIAADYNYIGEIRNSEENYEEAMICFEKAINLCEDANVTCLALFYLNAGKTSLLMENYGDFEKYLKLAHMIVTEFDSYWKSSVLDAFIALSNFRNKEYGNTLKYLQKAISEVKTINNVRDIGMVYFIEAIIAFEIEESFDGEYDQLKQFLCDPSEIYYYNALKYLDEHRDRAEIGYIKKMRKVKQLS